MAKHLKNEAKKLSKSTGIPYHQCLNQVSRAAGNASYNDFAKKNALTKKSSLPKIKPTVVLPKPLTLTYYMLTAQNGEKRPNARMSVENHLEIGALLKEVYQATEYNKKARKTVAEIRGLLDDWVQCEYTDHNELSNEVFFQMYYGDAGHSVQISPTADQKAELVRKCYKARGIITRSYHECRPVISLQKKLDTVIKAINAWPELKKEKHKGVYQKRLIPGTIVYLKGEKSPRIVFHHSFRDGLVTVYSDRGPGSVARHEVSVFRDQSKYKGFMPMRLQLPYGKWTCADGTEVLYNRDYCPIWTKSPDGKISGIDPDFWVNYEKDDHFFKDSNAPWAGERNNASLDFCLQQLKDWNVINERSKLLELLPLAIAAGDIRLLRPKNMNKVYPLTA